MQPAIVTPRNSPFPGSKVKITGWKVENIGILVDLQNTENSPYVGENLWYELDKWDESGLFCRLREEYGIEYDMTCAKTGRLWQGQYHDFGETPVMLPGFTHFSSIGLFTACDLDYTYSGTSRSALEEIRDWLHDEDTNNSHFLYEIEDNWLSKIDRSYKPQKLGHIVSAADTAAYVTLYHRTIYPFWGDVNSDVLAKYVDLDEISDELADLLNYTKTQTSS
jgi:hypothetical protein